MRQKKLYKVYVYNNHGGSRIHTNRPLAYLRYLASNACIHEVMARSGYEAKKVAIKEHRENEHDQSDIYCHGCPGLGAKV